MKRILLLILPFILAACTEPVSTASAFEQTKQFSLTVEARTITANQPKNAATLAAIVATKSAGGTAMAETMTSLPTDTPGPTMPIDSSYCAPADLSTTFRTMGATQGIFAGVGLTNKSSKPCYLQAWPQIVLVDAAGKALDLDYYFFDAAGGSTLFAATEEAEEINTVRVGLPPGWTEWMNLVWSNWCGGAISGGTVIHLKLGEKSGIMDVRTGIQGGGVCNAPGYRSSLGISKLGDPIPPP